jgi:hypothetical protein
MWKNHIKLWKYKALLTGEKGQQTLIKTENTENPVFNKMI